MQSLNCVFQNGKTILNASNAHPCLELHSKTQAGVMLMGVCKQTCSFQEYFPLSLSCC